MTKTLLLILILFLAGFMAFIPHIGYTYPLHADEWTHLTYAKTIAYTGAITFLDPFTGLGTSAPGIDNVWVGYHVLLAVFQEVTGIDWLLLFRFGPSLIFMLTVLCVYIFANKQGYGLEAAFFTCLIPTTGGLLGPAFLVPMALGLFFIALSLYIAFYVKSWQSYLLLFLIACVLWLMHPTSAIIQGIVLLPLILITLIRNRGRGLGLLTALLLPVLIALPVTMNQIQLAFGQMVASKEVFPPPYLDIPAVLQIYGFVPLIFCFIGIIYVLNKGGRYNYGLIVGLVLLLIIMLAFARFQIGKDSIFVRGVSSALLLIGITAGAGLYWLRTQLVSARFLNVYKPYGAAYFGDLLCTLSMVVILSTAVPSRLSLPYYHMIDDEDYRAFAWIRDNIGPEYKAALVDPWKATAFTAVTGKKVPRRIWEKEEPVDKIIYRFLEDECQYTTILRDNSVSFIYNRGGCDNPDIVQVRRGVFITNPNIRGSFNATNLVRNPDFEYFGGKPPEFWDIWSQNCDRSFLFPEEGLNGGSCVAIRMIGSEPYKESPIAVWGQNIPIQEGKSYYIGGWVKTEDVVGLGGAKIRVNWLGPKSTWIGISDFMIDISGTNEWTFYQGKVKALPGATIGNVVLWLSSNSGTAWYDSIAFKNE